MEQEQREKSIYLKDLLFAVLYQWRKVLIVATVLALVFGGYKGLSQYRAAGQNGSDAEDYEQARAALEQEIQRLEQCVDSQSAYLSDSVLMKLNPFHVYKASLDVYVQSDYQIMPSMTYQNRDNTAATVGAGFPCRRNSKEEY